MVNGKTDIDKDRVYSKGPMEISLKATGSMISCMD